MSRHTITAWAAMAFLLPLAANAQSSLDQSAGEWETLSTEELASLPFEADANVIKINLYRAVSLDDLIRHGVIGADHDIKMHLFGERLNRLEIPGYRLRYDTILGYDPETDEKRPYQEVFDPNVKYKLYQGGFDISGEGFGKCEGFSSVYSSGSYLYLERDLQAKEQGSVQCPIDVLMKSYELMAFLERDRPEMYEIRQRDEAKSEGAPTSIENSMMTM